MWGGFHIATVWANCNHNYDNPSFDITQGRLIEGLVHSVEGNPNYIYDTSIVDGNGHSYTVNVSFEKAPTVEYKRIPLNVVVNWEYQIKLTITESWKETVTIPDPNDPAKEITVTVTRTRTFVERQGVETGRHYIPE